MSDPPQLSGIKQACLFCLHFQVAQAQNSKKQSRNAPPLARLARLQRSTGIQRKQSLLDEIMRSGVRSSCVYCS